MKIPSIKRVLVSPPAEPVVTATELRRHLFAIYDNTEDSFLESLIQAATNHVENITWRKLVTQTWRLYLDSWPEDEILLPFGSVLSVDLIKWLDDEGTDHLMPETEYIQAITGETPMVLPKTAWPDGDLYDSESIRVEFKAGYGTADKVPPPLKHAILMLAAHWYENREAIIVGTTVRNVPLAFEALTGPYRLRYI